MKGRHLLAVFAGVTGVLVWTGCERHSWEGSTSDLFKPHHGHEDGHGGGHGEEHGAEGAGSSGAHGEEHSEATKMDDHGAGQEAKPAGGEGRSVFGQ